jgi:hypothetical protein
MPLVQLPWTSGLESLPWALDLLLLWIIVVVALQLKHYDFETLIALTACTHSLAKHSRHQVSPSGPLQAGLMHAGPFKLELVILVRSNLLPDTPDSRTLPLWTHDRICRNPVDDIFSFCLSDANCVFLFVFWGFALCHVKSN